jgi:hypothetical protein
MVPSIASVARFVSTLLEFYFGMNAFIFVSTSCDHKADNFRNFHNHKLECYLNN